MDLMRRASSERFVHFTSLTLHVVVAFPMLFPHGLLTALLPNPFQFILILPSTIFHGTASHILKLAPISPVLPFATFRSPPPGMKLSSGWETTIRSDDKSIVPPPPCSPISHPARKPFGMSIPCERYCLNAPGHSKSQDP